MVKFLKTIKYFALWIVLFVAYPFGSYSSSFKGMTIAQQNDLVQAYWGSFNKFKDKMCDPTDKATFDKLFKEYKGAGYYIPLYKERVVKASIVEILPMLEGKITWLKKQISQLEKLKELPVLSSQIQDLHSIIEENTKLRYQVDIGVKSEEAIRLAAKEQILQFKKKFTVFLSSIFYLKNYTFPVDHHFNRLTYDRLASQDVPNAPAGTVPPIVVQKLSLYLKRKFLEDGAMDPDLTRTDLFVRTTLDTFTLAIEKLDIYFTSEIIRDWDWIARSIQGAQTRGLAQQKLRLGEWLGRTVATKKYYEGLLNQEQFNETKILSELAVAADNLRNFVELKLANVYSYWLNQPDALKNLFVLETILMHEVGGTDLIGDQRKRVTEVVLNRVNNKEYHFLRSTDPWEKLLGKKLRDKKHWWLNVMYRRGEFSFMHFFMQSAYKVFCPEVTPAVNRLRESNLKIAIDVLKTYERNGVDTNVYRYFSRVSMLGRIDMTSVWSPPFELVEEAPGSRVETVEENKLLQLWGQGHWKYLYSFKVDVNTYRVFELEGKLWTTLWDKTTPTQFYHYLDRDYFKFFRLP